MESMLLKNGTVITEAGEETMDVLVQDGVIHRGASAISNQQSAILDASGLLIFPGLIDCHVHFREPGLTHKATMASESASALAGGVTTVCEMPNTVPPTTTVEAFLEKVRIANRSASLTAIDIRFFFGATKPEHLAELEKLFTDPSLEEAKKRCSGLKIYFDHSTGNQGADAEVIEKAFALAGRIGFTVVCHCEDAAMNAVAAASHPLRTVADHSLRRPPEAEEKAIAEAIGYAKKHRAHLHVAHLSTKQGIALVRDAKKRGIDVTCEVAPHHLFLSTEDYARLGGFAKMNPPLRSSEHVEALWAGIADQTVDCVATDHAPHTRAEKADPDPAKVPSGVPGVATMLPLLLGAASRKRLSYADIVRLCFANPNRIFGLGKQGIREGAPADLVLIDPAAAWTIRFSDLRSACDWTPFEGVETVGRVKEVLRHGRTF